MPPSVNQRLMWRELGGYHPSGSTSALYADKQWVDGLDIVQELHGHNGCVNALCWSDSGRLLASGSDDQLLNIYTYQPGSSSLASLNTTIHTGHAANILSVKFMPHSGDRTVITSSFDSQVRVFDIEYLSGHNKAPNANWPSTRVPSHAIAPRVFLSSAIAPNVYNSHSGSVRRIVTDSSPHYFLTCSADGTVRQWDLREPSSVYSRGERNPIWNADEDSERNVPPPLISYRKYGFELNTISCSPSQPQYIAVGGEYRTCFLHDRRMCGRDLMCERGQPGGQAAGSNMRERDEMDRSTRCIRRFAPDGRGRPQRKVCNKVTACKISNSNPNEILVSWYGDHIYSFNIHGLDDDLNRQYRKNRVRKSGRKSKKKRRSRAKNEKSAASHSKSLDSSASLHSTPQRRGGMTFRVRYQNGDSQEIPIHIPRTGRELSREQSPSPNESQARYRRICNTVIRAREALFRVDRLAPTVAEGDQPLRRIRSFQECLEIAGLGLVEIRAVMRQWQYPLNPAPEEVHFQTALRKAREEIFAFIQAAATFSRFLCGYEEVLGDCEQISVATTDVGLLDVKLRFNYDFLKAILLWLEGGRPLLAEGFRRGATPGANLRLPIDADSGEEGIETTLMPYLRGLASLDRVFEADYRSCMLNDSCIVYENQIAAVEDFARIVQKPSVSHADDTGSAGLGDDGAVVDRSRAWRFWGLKIGRSMLIHAGQHLTCDYIKRAFGAQGTRLQDREITAQHVRQRLNPEGGTASPIESVDIFARRRRRAKPASRLAVPHLYQERRIKRYADNEVVDIATPGTSTGLDHSREVVGPSPASSRPHHENGTTYSDNVEIDDRYEDSFDFDDEEAFGMIGTDYGSSDEESDTRRNLRFRELEPKIPCVRQTHVYRGHCNIETLKEVDYFGLQDEYVVSGSDAGHVFIWNRKTSQLVNILQGDGEVVNVVQGHPYEPTLAVSGIDTTVKLFSPDARIQRYACVGVTDHPDTVTPLEELQRRASRAGNSVSNVEEMDDGFGDNEGPQSCKKMHESYQIISENDVRRRGTGNDAFITRHVLTQMFGTMRRGRAATQGQNGQAGTGADCSIM